MNSIRLLGIGLKPISRPIFVSNKLISLRSLQMSTKRAFTPTNQNYIGNSSIIFKSGLQRAYSTSSAPPPPPPPPPKDKNAKGRVLLSRLSRAFTFSLSTLLVIGASGVALLVVFLILSELFLPSGDTKTFNKAVKLVEKNEEARKLLQLEDHERVRAYGESPVGKWVRNRPVQSMRMRDKDGKDRLVMKFHVESNAGKHGTVSLEQIDKNFWSSEFAYIALDIHRQKRIYIIEPKFQPKNYVPSSGEKSGFLGLKWGPKKE